MMPCEKRLLVITNTFFPHPKVAAVRMTQWCRHLPEFDWKPTVLCRYYGFAATVPALAQSVHSAVDVVYLNGPLAGRVIHAAGDAASSPPAETSAHGPHDRPEEQPHRPYHGGSLQRTRLQRYFSYFIAGGLRVPDMSITFWRSMRREILSQVRRVKPAAILTTSPSHAVHDLGLWLVQQFPELPWVADFRDPYLIDGRYGPKGLGLLVAQRHRNFERAIYAKASLVTHAIPVQARWARRQYPDARGKIKTLLNGFPVDLVDGSITAAAKPPDRRIVCSMGSRDDEQCRSLASAIAALNERGHALELRLVGKTPSNLDQVRAILGDDLHVTGHLTYEGALSNLLSGDVLVCMVPREKSSALVLSSKLFEYLALGRPVLVVNPPRPDQLFLRKRSGVRLLYSPSAADWSDAVVWALRQDAVPSTKQVESFRRNNCRRSQVERLAGWLNQLVESQTLVSRDA